MSDLEAFVNEFGTSPQNRMFSVVAPGRLSILGEHIDYSGYGVFAFAIEQNINIFCSVNNLKVFRLHNVDSKFSKKEVPINDMKIDPSNLHWTDYVVCGLKGVLYYCNSKIADGGDFHSLGVDFLVSGDIPLSAGLSSSSALVCASALAYATCCNLNLSSVELAEMCASNERYVGTQGGGLDQAACMLSEEGKALSIQFNPLSVETVSLPKGACFVVMNTLIAKWKAASPEYNTRVAECKLAASIIAVHQLGMNFEHSDFLTLGQIHKLLNLSYSEMVAIVNGSLKDNCSPDSIENDLGLSWDLIMSKFLNFPKDVKQFNLNSRSVHVYEEAERTEDCVHLCKLNPESLTDEQQLEKIGSLMNSCHASCQSLFECSCEELDELVSLSNKCGAYGAQLCGAGWGGCAIALVPSSNVEFFMTQMKEKYYNVDEYRKNNFDSSTMFVTKPSKGAHVNVIETK